MEGREDGPGDVGAVLGVLLDGGDRPVLVAPGPQADGSRAAGVQSCTTRAGYGGRAAGGRCGGAAVSGDTARAERVTDRQEALARALAITPANGVVLVAGKGHETYQIFGTEKHTWDDRVALRQAWSARGGA